MKKRSANDDLNICNKVPENLYISGRDVLTKNIQHYKGVEGNLYPKVNIVIQDATYTSEEIKEFVVMAREALPYWINRAIKLENKINESIKD